MDWLELRLPFNVFKSFSAVAQLSLCASAAIHLLYCLVSTSMKNDSYTGYSLPANSVAYILSSSFTPFRVIVLVDCGGHLLHAVKLLSMQEVKNL